MRIQLAYISPRRELKSASAKVLAEEYVGRCGRFVPTTMEPFRSEESLAEMLARRTAREPPHVVLLDSRGRALSSPQIALHLRQQRDGGAQLLVLAVGPADGWSVAMRSRASLLLSFGAITLPHELALVVLAEQTYRALAILAGHPYHSGHE